MGDITLESNLKAVLGPGFQSKPGEEAAKTEDGKTFSQTLADSLGKVNDIQQEADTAIEGLVSGKSQNIHETMNKKKEKDRKSREKRRRGKEKDN